MHSTFRLRTAMAIMTIGAIFLAYFTIHWQRGDFAFQRRHARLARKYESDANSARVQLRLHVQHSVPGHVCSFLAGTKTPLTSRSFTPPCPGADTRRNTGYWREAVRVDERNSRLHRWIAGPAHERSSMRIL
jgi:hypothetical protein